MNSRTIQLLFYGLTFSFFSVVISSVLTQDSDDDSDSQISIDLLAPTANQRRSSTLLENLQASSRYTLQVARQAECSADNPRLDGSQHSETTQRANHLEETLSEGTQIDNELLIGSAPVNVDENQDSGSDFSGFILAQYTPEEYAQREDFQILSPIMPQNSVNPFSNLLNWKAVKSGALFVFDADFASDPVLAARAHDHLIPGSKLIGSGIVGKVAGQEDCYFAFPFKTESILDYLVSSQASYTDPRYLQVRLNHLLKTPDKKRQEPDTCPYAPLAKRARYLQVTTSNSFFKNAPTGWSASRISALEPYLADLNELMKNLVLPAMNSEYLIAFEQEFHDIFMKACRQFKVQMLLPALLLSMLPESDFSKFHEIRKIIDFESLDSTEFAQRFLLAVMKLPAISVAAFDFLSSSINAPFLFNHECSGQSNLYAGKFCFEQVVAAVKHTEAQASEANLLTKWLISEIKKPFELNTQTAIMSIVYLEYISICFATREAFLRFLMTLFKFYIDNQDIRKAVDLCSNPCIKDGKLSHDLLRFALETEDVIGIGCLYSILTLESAEPGISNHIRTINIRDDHPLYYALEIENSLDKYSYSITDRKVIILPKIKK